ncbi:FHA domain-containing protein [Actinomadura macrotermitis]|uniref:FHA domain-containing protein n=1 Tax=Actinomadura macrotermitis TaxID=2585200 RepID=A0A7K0BVQ8_9ACTN|nr:FHA domain-containing protein [Actinomadura macrotermitis]MQY04982.1 hypothetical protein [Actinomadura macrotermitis]
MATCPNGHPSDDPDYCDVCGDLMDGAARADLDAPRAAPAPAAPERAETCPTCGAARSGRFCEEDGYDFELGTAPAPEPAEAPPGPPPALTGWSVLITADRAYHAAVLAQEGPDAATLAFPENCPDRRVPLLGDKVRIGRRSVARGLLPEIDLAVPPGDPGVSHTHAALVAVPGGGWTIVDAGSVNGTTVNDDPAPIPPNTPVPLAPGDRVHVGAWTTITLHHHGEGSS